MADEKLSALPEKSTVAATDLFLMTDVPGGTESKRLTGSNLRAYTDNTQAELGGILFARTQPEIDNSITPVSLQYEAGWTFRYMTAAEITDVQNRVASLDVTTAVQNAIDSGHPARFNAGHYAIESTLIVASDGGLLGGKHLVMSASVRLERFTNVTTPIMHVYGVQNRLELNGMQFASRTFASPNGIFLLGPDPDAVDASGPDQVATQHNWIDDFKIIGQTDTLGSDGSRGFYVHSAARKRGVWLGITTFYNRITQAYVIKSDVPYEFSSDANANKLSGTAINYGRTALMFNASYGNQCRDMLLESPIEISTTRRYAITYGQQNDPLSGETGTSASYPIHASLNDRVEGFAETLNTGNQIVSVFFTYTPANPPSAGTNYGQNRQGLMGAQPAGQGPDGQTDEADIYDTVIDNDTALVNWHRPILFPGMVFKRLDDDSGAIRYQDSTAWIDGRKADMVESFTYDLFSIDNVGATSASLLIELTIQSKDSTGQDHLGGPITFMCPVTASTARRPLEVVRHFQHFGNDSEPALVPIVVEETGTAADTGKFTVKLATQVTTGTGDFFCSWSAKLVSSNLNDESTNLDWTGDVSLLTSSTSELILDSNWSRKTKFTLLDKPKTEDIALADDFYMHTYDLLPDTEYIVRGEVEVVAAAAPDFKCNFAFTQATQSVRIVLSYMAQVLLQTADTGTEMSVTAAPSSGVVLTFHGIFKTNATTGGDVSFQWAQDTSSVAATTVKAGSSIEIVRFDAMRSELL